MIHPIKLATCNPIENKLVRISPDLFEKVDFEKITLKSCPSFATAPVRFVLNSEISAVIQSVIES